MNHSGIVTIIILKNFAATYQLVCPIIYTAVWVTPDALIGLLDPEVTACRYWSMLVCGVDIPTDVVQGQNAPRGVSY